MSNFFDEAKDLAGDHPDQVSDAIDKGEDFANEKTGGKYEDQISDGADKLEGELGIGGDQGQDQNQQ